MITAELLQETLLPKFDGQIAYNRDVHLFLDMERSDQIGSFIPRKSTPEHQTISEYSKTPWGMKIINSEAGSLRVEGIRNGTGVAKDAWSWWKRVNMGEKEPVLYREAPEYGATFVEARKSAGNVYPVVKCPLKTAVFRTVDGIGDALSGEYPLVAMERQDDNGSLYKIWDERTVTYWSRGEVFGQWNASEPVPHGFPVCPFVEYRTDVDSEGKSIGRIRPFRHQINRIRKVTYDATMVNHHNSWNVRTATGLGDPADLERIPGETDSEFHARVAQMEEKMKIALEIDSVLTAASKDVSFGSLPATNPASFVPVREYEVRELSAVTDIPSEFLSGQVIAQSAEQAANSRKNWNRIIKERKASYGNSHLRLLKLEALGTGKTWDDSTQIVWDDDDEAALAAKVDALGKAATMLKIPVEALWEEFPGVTPEKLERWMKLKKEQDARELAMTSMIADMSNSGTTDPDVAAYDEADEAEVA